MRNLKWFLSLLLLVGVVVGGVGYWQRTTLITWYAVRGLTRADEADRQVWIDRLIALGEPAVPALLDALQDERETARNNALAALDAMNRHHGLDNPATATLVQQQVRLFARLDPGIQKQMLDRTAGWFTDHKLRPADEVLACCGRLLSEGANAEDEDVQGTALEFAAVLMKHPTGNTLQPSAREAIRAGLRSSSAVTRLRAIQLTLLPGMGLHEQVVGLLQDSAVEVRRAAILAVGPADQVVRDESLLPCLHDTDAQVRQLAESALCGRGLKPEHLALGRLLTHPRPEKRLQVLDHLEEVIDLDPGLWLRRLSHDSSPSVRAAALRVMSGQTEVDLTDRIDQMARQDPSPTVSQLARFYLMGRKGSIMER